MICRTSQKSVEWGYIHDERPHNIGLSEFSISSMLPRFMAEVPPSPTGYSLVTAAIHFQCIILVGDTLTFCGIVLVRDTSAF